MRIFALPAFLTLTSLLAADPGPDSQGGLSFYLDNDLFGNSDRDYTNGARLAWSSPDFLYDDLHPLAQAITPLTFFEKSSDTRYNFGLSLTQFIFTPDDNLLTTQPPDQRRYAGWSGLGFSVHAKDDSILHSLEFTIGTTGPDSLAEDSQDLIHDVRNIPEFNGWDNQVPNEITADLSFTQKRLHNLDLSPQALDSLDIQNLTTWGVRLGTFRTSAHIGAALRIGFHLPQEFGDHRAFDDNAYPIRLSHPDPSTWSIFAIFGTNLHAVAYDATLDGPLFTDFNTGNHREPLVAEVYAGLGLRYRNAELSYIHTWRTKDYEEQNNRISDLGSVAIRLRF